MERTDLLKVIIAGSRTILNYRQVCIAVKLSAFNITEVVSGVAKGPDKLGEQWAAEHNIPVKRFHADWNRLGRAAGPIRNQQMGEYADAAVIVWDGSSSGSKNMMDVMHQLTKPCFVYTVSPIDFHLEI